MIDTKLNITLEEGQKVFFTSDLHFGHKNVIKFCNRPWEDEKAMGKGLIENWNSVVSNNDIVFSLGDFCWWESNTEVRKILKHLNGKEIYLIPGNHCVQRAYRTLPENVHVLDSCVTVYIQNIYKDKPGKPLELFLCHYPLMTWPHRGYGVVQLFGHIHSGPVSENKIDIPGKDLNLWPGQQYDVGADNNNYVPVELREIFSRLGREENFK